MKSLPSLEALQLSGRTVFVRLDLNVPMQDGKILSDARITASLPTLKHCLEAGARVAVASHLGRPNTSGDAAFSMEPVAARLGELLQMEVVLASDCIGDGVRGLMHTARPGQLVVLENLRFHPGEEACDAAFSKALAQPFDCYINDAFGVSHRAHASTVGMVRYCREVAAGLLVEKEVAAIAKVMEAPKKHFVACIGGAKVADKAHAIEALIGHADTVLIGGAMAYTFLKALGHTVGDSKFEADRLHLAKELVQRAKDRNTALVLPEDHWAAKKFSKDAEPVRITTPSIPEGMIGLDIGPKTRDTFVDAIRCARTVLWNGPMGVSEWPAFAKGTHAVAQSVAACTGYTVVGGGESAAALEAAGVAPSISHISTGGGACLELLKSGTLPGLEALRRAQRS